jgi:TonB family protein
MTAPHFLFRDRRDWALRLSLTLILSIAAHLVLIFAVRGTQIAVASKTTARVLEARLVDSREAAPANISPENMPILPPLPKLTKVPGKPRENVAALAPRLPPPNLSPTVALPLPFDPTYYTWREVDVTAKFRDEENLPYPKVVADASVSGRVVIEVWVDETGKVDDAKVIEADPPGHVEEAIVAYYRGLAFSPAMKDGKTKRFRARFLVEFGEPPAALDPGTK